MMKDDSTLWIRNDNKQVKLREDKNIIGRFYSCDICLMNRNVSRVHAEIFMKDNNWYIRDLESRNGTWLNGERLIPWEEYHLHDNDMISLSHNKEIMCFNRTSAEEDQHAAERTLVKAICSFNNSGHGNEVAFELIVQSLIKYPMYILLADNKGTGELSIGDIDTSDSDRFIKESACYFRITGMLPVFTSPEKAGVDGVFLRMQPAQWIKLAVRGHRNIIINPFQKERFMIPHLFMMIGIMPFLDE